MQSYDYVIVGSGIAGLYTALLAQEYGSVLVITKGGIEECNTQHAQGGIAAAIGLGDSPALHMEDTSLAGAGLSDPESVPEPQDRPSYDLRHAVTAGRLIAEAALTREESRGAHYRCDFPEPSPAWAKHLVYRKD